MSAQTTRWSTVTVAAVHAAAQGIAAIDLTWDRPVHGAPGSHIDVMVQVEGRAGIRSYSVVADSVVPGSATRFTGLSGSAPTGSGPGESGSGSAGTATTLRIAVRLAADGGGGSRYMHGLAVGDRLRATDPLQDFPLTHGRPGYVLVAGGIGITPLAPMYRALRGSGADVRLVYAGRDRAVMAFADALAAEGDRVELVVESEGATVDPAALVAAVPDGHEMYVCGPIGLLEAMRAAWRDDGRPAGRFRFETFGSSGQYAAEEFVVEVPRLSLRTTVPANRTLLETLRDAGAEMMFDCRRGECGLCEVRVVGCDGVIDHRDVFLSDTQRAQGDHLCTCVSRVAATDRGAGPATLVLDLP